MQGGGEAIRHVHRVAARLGSEGLGRLAAFLSPAGLLTSPSRYPPFAKLRPKSSPAGNCLELGTRSSPSTESHECACSKEQASHWLRHRPDLNRVHDEPLIPIEDEAECGERVNRERRRQEVQSRCDWSLDEHVAVNWLREPLQQESSRIDLNTPGRLPHEESQA